MHIDHVTLSEAKDDIREGFILNAEGATTSYPKGENLVVRRKRYFKSENEILRFTSFRSG
jgi:hypothetical protein